MTTPRIDLNRTALRSNVSRAQEIIGPDCRVMFAVKSNAYGHGMELVAAEVIDAGAAELAVLDIPTGLLARATTPTAPLFAWLLGPDDDYREAIEGGIELGVSTGWQLEAIARYAPQTPVTVHLKVDTGLNRNGATLAQWPSLVRQARELEQTGVVHVRAIWSHLADTSPETSREALGRLHDAAATAQQAGLAPDVLHLAASQAAIELPEARLDMVRLGILGYGVSPFSETPAQQWGFHPVLTLHAPVTAIDQTSLTLGVGFTHGLLPTPPGVGPVNIGGTRCVVEAVDAGETRLSFNDPPDLVVGDEVPLLGGVPGAVPVEQWAAWCNTIGDEVLVRLRPELPRRLSD